MPSIFIGHGNPMNAIERNDYTAAWEGLAATLPRPGLILSVSAHWYVPGSRVTANEWPRTIHDFTYAWGQRPVQPYDWAARFETRLKEFIHARRPDWLTDTSKALPREARQAAHAGHNRGSLTCDRLRFPISPDGPRQPNR